MKRWLLLVTLAAACGDDTIRSADPDIFLARSELDFGGIPVLNENIVELVVKNKGGAPLTLVNVTIRERGVPFEVTEAPELIEGGVEESIKVAFTPPATAPYTATLLVDSDDPDSPFLEVPLRGEGTTVAVIEVTPLAIDFGRVGEGQTALRRVKVESLGTADLIVEKVAFEEGTAPGYGLIGSNKTPAILAAPHDGFPGESIELNVKYTPAEGTTQTQGALLVDSTDPQKRRLRVSLTAGVNRAPIPLAKLAREADARVTPFASVRFDGSESYDPDSDQPVTWSWSISTQPFGSQATIEGADTFNPILHTDLAGIYEVELEVTDAEGLASLRPARVLVTAVPPADLFVELVWQNDRTDLDLHFRPFTAGLFTALDCYWNNRQPDLGQTGPGDDPLLENDDLSGYGPEVVTYEQPVEDTYRIGVQLRAFNGAITPTSPATVRVYLYGVVKAELKRTMTGAGEWWDVGTVQWPSGKVVATP